MKNWNEPTLEELDVVFTLNGKQAQKAEFKGMTDKFAYYNSNAGGSGFGPVNPDAPTDS